MASNSEPEYFLKDPFSELLSDVRAFVRARLASPDDSAVYELLSFAPAYLLRDPDSGNRYGSGEAWTHTIPMLIAKFSVDQRKPPGPASSQSPKIIGSASRKPLYTNSGLPLMALLWVSDPQTAFLRGMLQYFHVPWIELERKTPAAWVEKRIRDQFAMGMPTPRVAPLVSDPQHQLARSLGHMESRMAWAAEVVPGAMPQFVVQQEVMLSSVIGYSAGKPPSMLERGSFDFVVFYKDHTPKVTSQTTGARWQPVLAIEYDGADTHWKTADRERDRRKDEICKKARLPLLRLTKEFLAPDPRYPPNNMREQSARHLRHSAIHQIIVSALFAPGKHGRITERIKSWRTQTISAHDSDKYRAHALVQKFQEMKAEHAFDRSVSRWMQLQQLKQLTGVDLHVSIEKKKGSHRLYARIEDCASGLKRESPTLELKLVSSSLGLQASEIADDILFAWILDDEVRRHGLDPAELLWY